MILYLIRHGQTDANIEGIYQGNMDVELNDKGKEQAKRLAWRLRNFPFDALFVSHLKRALDTANTILEYHDLTPKIKKDLEEISMGEWQGKTREEVKKTYAAFIKDRESKKDFYTRPIPGGESYVAFQKRAVGVFEDILKETEGKHVAVVCHGGIIKAVIGHLLSLDITRHRDFEIYNTSITTIEYDKKKDRLRLITLNDTAHLV